MAYLLLRKDYVLRAFTTSDSTHMK